MRCPWLKKGEAARSLRIRSRSSASDTDGFGIGLLRVDPLVQLLRPFLTIVEPGTSLLPHAAYPFDFVSCLDDCGDRLVHFDRNLCLAKGPGFLPRCHRSLFFIVSSSIRLIAPHNPGYTGSPSRSLSATSMPESTLSRPFPAGRSPPPTHAIDSPRTRLAAAATPLLVCGLRSCVAPKPSLLPVRHRPGSLYRLLRGRFFALGCFGFEWLDLNPFVPDFSFAGSNKNAGQPVCQNVCQFFLIIRNF